MITGIESLGKNSYFLQNFELKNDGLNINHISLPTKQEKHSKEVNLLNNSEIIKNYFNIFDKTCSLEDNDLSNEDLYFINNEALSSTDAKSSNNQTLMLSKKRNNKNKTKRKKAHNKFEKDNIMRKLNIHYISFIVKFVNFNIKQLISKKHPLFTNLCYDFKQKINNSTFNELKNKTIGEVLKNKGSNKNKRTIEYQSDENEKVYNSVYPALKDLLDINYIQFFRQVYTRSSKDKIHDNKSYKIPHKILFFEDLLNKETQKDKIKGELYRERLKYISKKEFINGGYPFFETKTIEKKRK